MVSVAYSHRLLCDSEFIIWLSQQVGRETILSYLMHIKSSSQDCKREHNIILKQEAEACNEKIENKYMGGAFKIVEEPSFLIKYDDLISKTLVFGISLTEDPPFKCYLLTSPEKEMEYKKSKHYENVTTLQIISGEKAIRIIKSFFNAFSYARDIGR